MGALQVTGIVSLVLAFLSLLYDYSFPLTKKLVGCNLQNKHMRTLTGLFSCHPNTMYGQRETQTVWESKSLVEVLESEVYSDVGDTIMEKVHHI